MAVFCDLHNHSTFSDGTDTPTKLVALAEERGLGAIALTDHNTVAGLPDFLSAAEEAGAEVEIFQSNHEGTLVDEIQAAYGVFDGIVINPGAYAHYSYAIRDAIKAITIPVVEVHISDIGKREEFRHHSMISRGCMGVICGFGLDSYRLAI